MYTCLAVPGSRLCHSKPRYHLRIPQIRPPSLTVDTVHKPIKTVATASKLPFCVILCLALSFFSSFAHQTARVSIDIVRPHGIRRSVMVITQKCNDPAYKPPPHFYPMLACTKGRGGRNCGILRYNIIIANKNPGVQHERKPAPPDDIFLV